MDDYNYDYELLKRTRLEKNLTADGVAFDLCLTERQIHSIEHNLPDYFYSPTIKLACIKKYAEKLGLDIETVLYKKQDTVIQKEIPKEVETIAPLKEGAPVVHPEIKKSPLKVKASTRPHRIKNQSRHPIIQQATMYIQNHLSEKITMHDLKKITGYSERSLQLVFKEHFNQTPFEFIEEQRLLKAKSTIEKYKTSKKIAEVAEDVGLTHLGRFSVNFKKRFGIPPSLLAKS